MKFLIFIKNKKSLTILLFIIILVLSSLVRLFLLPHESGDMKKYLLNWLQYYRDFPWWHALKAPISNYSAPYNYFLLLIHFLQKYGNIQINDVFMIKFISIIFDYFAATIIGLIVFLNKKKFFYFVISFGLVIFAPTIVLNSSHWGQSDVIYSCFIATSVLFVILKKPTLAVIAFAIAFAFKSQGIFFAPFIFLMFLNGEIKWWHGFVFLVSYLIMNFPSIYVGVPLFDLLFVYFKQAGSQWRMTYNAPNIYQIPVHIFRFFNGSINLYYDKLKYVALFLTAVASIGFSFIFKSLIKKSDNGVKIKLALLSLLIVPFLLPAMHERYFFSADLLSIAVPFYDKKLWYLPFLLQGASLASYLNAYMSSSIVINSYPSFIGMIFALSAIIILFINLINLKDHEVE